MKNTVVAISMVFLTFLGSKSFAQNDITDFFDFGTENMTQLAKSYIAPLGYSLGNNLNSGWYNTGQAHRIGRFDIRLAVPVTFVGQDQRYFTFNPEDYSGLLLVNADDNQVPTFFGDDRPGPEVYFEGTEGFDQGTFELPPGTGIDFFPVIPPALQLNVGLIRDTEVMVRYVPDIKFEGFSTGLYGFGIKHGIDQYIPVVERLPLDISLIASYASMASSYELDYNQAGNANSDQLMDLSTTAYSVNLIASTRLPIITFYGGVRYMYSDTEFLMLGNYDVGTIVLTDPVETNIAGSQFGLNAGTRIKLGFFSIFVDGTLARYSSVTGGISLGFHN